MSQVAVEHAVWALIPDLFLRVRVEGLARATATSCRSFADPGALLAALTAAASAPRLVVVDLHARDEAAFTLLTALGARADAPPTLGFHSHVDVGIRERALAAGCSRVVPRSALMQRFAALVAETPGAPA